MFRISTFAAAALIVAVPGVALAHHGWRSYDEAKPITVTGKFTSVAWASPHGSARMVWRKKQWDIILAPVSRMEARGLTQDMIAPGKRVTITGYARRDGTNEMRIERVKVGDKTVELR